MRLKMFSVPAVVDALEKRKRGRPRKIIPSSPSPPKPGPLDPFAQLPKEVQDTLRKRKRSGDGDHSDGSPDTTTVTKDKKILSKEEAMEALNLLRRKKDNQGGHPGPSSKVLKVPNYKEEEETKKMSKSVEKDEEEEEEEEDRRQNPIEDRDCHHHHQQKKSKITLVKPYTMPVYIPKGHKFLLVSLCQACLDDSNKRIRMTSGREVLTFILCPSCVLNNKVLANAFKL